MQISKELKVAKWAKSRASILLDTHQDLERIPEFEVDKFCEKHVLENLTEDWNRNFARSARNHGIKKEYVASILRNELKHAIVLIRAGRAIEQSLRNESGVD